MIYYRLCQGRYLSLAEVILFALIKIASSRLNIDWKLLTHIELVTYSVLE